MQTVIGAFDDRATVQRAVERLVQEGIARDDVHVEQSEGGTSGMQSASSQAREGEEDRGVLSSFGHFFASLFGQDNPSRGQAGRYSEAVRRGTSVVVVDADTEMQADLAATVMHEMGAIDVDERAQQWRDSGWSGDEIEPGADGVVEVVQEELQVGKRSVDRGGVRVIQRVSQQPVRELIRLREERAVVDRHAVDRPATAEDLAAFQEGTIEVRETIEEPVVAKSAHVVEEVRIGKEVREREQTIEDTVRRKDVEIERMEGEGRSIEREERALASGRNDEALTSRDPDATRLTLNKKPRNS